MKNLGQLGHLRREGGFPNTGDPFELLFNILSYAVLTIYGPMIYTAPFVMCLMGANPLQGPLEGLGHESQDFFGPLKQLEKLKALLYLEASS